MGRLYWKIFCAFVLTVVAVSVVVGTTVWYHQRSREAIAVDVAIGPRTVVLVNAAATTLRHGGLAGLRELLGDWERFGSGRPPVLAVGTSPAGTLRGVGSCSGDGRPCGTGCGATCFSGVGLIAVASQLPG